MKRPEGNRGSQGDGWIRRSIRLLFGDWLPHDGMRLEGYLDLAAVIGTHNS